MEKPDDNSRSAFDRIGARWRESINRLQSVGVVDDETSDERRGGDHLPFGAFGVDYQEYQRAQQLKTMLLKTYKGKALEDVILGEELHTPAGTCYRIENRYDIDLNTTPSVHARERILSDLKLLYGIGDWKEQFLKEEGYRTIEDLVGHHQFGGEAERLLKIVDRRDTAQIASWIERWLPKSHPLAFCNSSFCDRNEFILVDIESMGLFGVPIILFGIARLDGDEIVISQYFLRNMKEEPAALAAFLSHVDENTAFITFNGRTFDIPYIRQRLVYYGMKADLDRLNFDVLHFSRRAWGKQLPNCRLTSLERHLLGVEREDDVPGALVPEFYHTYAQTQNVGPLVPIIEHNRQDLVALARIFSKLHEEMGQW